MTPTNQLPTDIEGIDADCVARSGVAQWAERTGVWTAAVRRDVDRVRLERSRARLAALEASLVHLNPQAVLERGYAIVTRPDETIVQDSATLKVGEMLKVRFARGTAEVGVNSKE